MSQPERVVLIVHPLRRHARAVASEARDLASALGLELRIEQTTPQRPGTQQAAEAADAGVGRVIAVGGDGTVRAVAAGLAGTGTPLGIVPTGTANLFALNLGLRAPRTLRGLRAALRTALTGAPRPHDVGRLTWHDQHDGAHDDVFMVVAGLGEDAAVVAGTSEALKARAGWPAYLLRGAARLSSPLHPIRLRRDDGPVQALEAWSVLIGSAPRIPLGIRVFPDVRTDSGDLELLRAAPASPLSWAGIAWHGLTRRPHRALGLHYDRARSLELSPQSPLPLQVDGDVLGNASAVQARADPGALLVVT